MAEELLPWQRAIYSSRYNTYTPPGFGAPPGTFDDPVQAPPSGGGGTTASTPAPVRALPSQRYPTDIVGGSLDRSDNPNPPGITGYSLADYDGTFGTAQQTADVLGALPSIPAQLASFALNAGIQNQAGQQSDAQAKENEAQGFAGSAGGTSSTGAANPAQGAPAPGTNTSTGTAEGGGGFGGASVGEAGAAGQSVDPGFGFEAPGQGTDGGGGGSVGGGDIGAPGGDVAGDLGFGAVGSTPGVYHQGGMVAGADPSVQGEDVPITAQEGEVVLSAEATQIPGVQQLVHYLNALVMGQGMPGQGPRVGSMPQASGPPTTALAGVRAQPPQMPQPSAAGPNAPPPQPGGGPIMHKGGRVGQGYGGMY